MPLSLFDCLCTAGVSPDTAHGTAMAFKFNELFNFNSLYLQEHAPGVKVRQGRSDGCRGQFKGMNFFGWLSEYWSSSPPWQRRQVELVTKHCLINCLCKPSCVAGVGFVLAMENASVTSNHPPPPPNNHRCPIPFLSGDPEGGSCKNAARNHELHSASGRKLYSFERLARTFLPLNQQ